MDSEEMSTAMSGQYIKSHVSDMATHCLLSWSCALCSFINMRQWTKCRNL